MATSLWLIALPLAAILGCLSVTAIILVPKHHRSGYIVAGAVCLTGLLAGSAIAIWMNEFGSDFASAPSTVDNSMIFGAVTASLALAGLLATGAAATLRRRNPRRPKK